MDRKLAVAIILLSVVSTMAIAASLYMMIDTAKPQHVAEPVCMVKLYLFFYNYSSHQYFHPIKFNVLNSSNWRVLETVSNSTRVYAVRGPITGYIPVTEHRYNGFMWYWETVYEQTYGPDTTEARDYYSCLLLYSAGQNITIRYLLDESTWYNSYITVQSGWELVGCD